MAQNISLMGADYPDVPAVQLPKTGGGTATYYDINVVDALDSQSTKDALSANQGRVLNGKITDIGSVKTYTAWSNKLTMPQTMTTILMFSKTTGDCQLYTYNSYTNLVHTIYGTDNITATKNNDGTVTFTAPSTGQFSAIVI